jgi:hypothetical protein
MTKLRIHQNRPFQTTASEKPGPRNHFQLNYALDSKNEGQDLDLKKIQKLGLILGREEDLGMPQA